MAGKPGHSLAPRTARETCGPVAGRRQPPAPCQQAAWVWGPAHSHTSPPATSARRAAWCAAPPIRAASSAATPCLTTRRGPSPARRPANPLGQRLARSRCPATRGEPPATRRTAGPARPQPPPRLDTHCPAWTWPSRALPSSLPPLPAAPRRFPGLRLTGSDVAFKIYILLCDKKKFHLIKNVDIVPGHPARESGYKLNIKSLMVHKEIFVSGYVYTGYK